MEAEPSQGSMVVLRDVPTRPAQKQGAGDALTVTTSPDEAFLNALDLSLSELDDADAALITSTALHGINQLGLVDSGAASADNLIADTLAANGLSFVNDPANSSAGSVVSGSIDSSLAATNAAINTAIGSIPGPLGGQNGGGQ